jgi:hypothetical protein
MGAAAAICTGTKGGIQVIPHGQLTAWAMTSSYLSYILPGSHSGPELFCPRLNSRKIDLKFIHLKV